MKNNIEIFNNDDFGEIRISFVNEKPYFVGKDVAKALGYVNPTKAVREHCSGGLKQTLIDSLGRKQEATFIPESDVYKLAFGSKLQSAQKFVDWVCEEVLPSIRKNGVYATEDFIQLSLDNPDYAIELLQSYKKAKKELEANKPKVEYCDNVLKAETLMPISKFCKDFGYSAPALNKILNELGVQFKMGNVWCLYAKYADKGYAHTTTFFIEQNNKTSLNLQWTEKGRNMIHDLLEKNGLLKNKIK